MSATRSCARRATLALALGLSAALILGATPAASADPVDGFDGPVPTELSTPADYIVTLADAPIAAYEGEVPGYDATQPADGETVDLSSGDARRYRSYLRERQDTVAARVGSRPEERYEVGVNAFTSRLTGQQAARLADTDGVLSVTKDSLRRVRDDRKPVDFLGLSGGNGVWSKLGGVDDAGRGVVVGVIDSGIWPESASFAGEPLQKSSGSLKPSTSTRSSAGRRYQPRRVGDTIVMTKSDGGVFHGTCEAGDDFTADDCDSKLVGARYFGDTWLSKVPAGERADSEFVSPRDGEGHGSHTASIAAGNHGVRAVVDDEDFGRISGVAPAAKIASYKVLWQAKDPTQSGAYESDVLAAINAAIADGVDVINFSLTAADNPTSPVQLAFKAAAAAGIFVAASAGNSGPTPSTVQSTAPWVTTVGAHTIAPYYGTVTLGDGQSYAGVSTTVEGEVGPAPLVTGSAAATGGASADASVCAPGSLDPAKASGAILVCDRGGNVDRLVKSAEVARAGGIGMVLVNLTANTLDADLHSVPTVHVNPPGSTAIKAYAATAGATATLTEGNQTSTSITYPQIAAFSGRGPSLGTGGDTLKPDLVAPGVSILGAVAPPSNHGQDFAFMSGTSQSAPQVAGLAALWFGSGVRPRWSPMQVKSALMTTAVDLLDEKGRPFTDPFAQGAGRVVPERMFSPGLVYPAGEKDWDAYLRGIGYDTRGRSLGIDPSDYNSPSIAIGRLLGTQKVTRRVTAVEPGRYRVSSGVPGVDVSVSPSELSFSHPGQTRTFTVTFTRTSAPFDEAATGFLTWKGQRATVRIPLAVTPRAVDAPVEVTGSGATGQASYRVTPGVSGAFPITSAGLVTGTPRGQQLPVEVGKSALFLVPVAADTKAARFTVQTADPRARVDLAVLRRLSSTTFDVVAQSATASASQSLVVPRPVAGDYVAVVTGVRNAPGSTTTAYVQRSALVRAGTGQGNFTVQPSSIDATAGRPVTLTASWSGLDADVPYAGWVEYPNGQGTVVSVN